MWMVLPFTEKEQAERDRFGSKRLTVVFLVINTYIALRAELLVKQQGIILTQRMLEPEVLKKYVNNNDFLKKCFIIIIIKEVFKAVCRDRSLNGSMQVSNRDQNQISVRCTEFHYNTSGFSTNVKYFFSFIEIKLTYIMCEFNDV